MEVGPLGLAAITSIVDEGFAGTPPGGLASRLFAFAAGHPRRTMQLADAAWSMLHDGVEPDLVWGRALEWRRVASASSHETRFSSLAPADQAVMRLAATGVVLFGHDVELLSLSRSSAQLGRKRLVERAQITETDRGVKVVDPLHAD